MNPRALVIPSSALCFSSSSPITLMRTRANDRSRVTSTEVTVTKPTRGSLTSEARASAIASLTKVEIRSDR